MILTKNIVHLGYDDVKADEGDVDEGFEGVLKRAHLRLYPDVAPSNLIDSLLRPLSSEEGTIVTSRRPTCMFGESEEAREASSVGGEGHRIAARSFLFADRVVHYQIQLQDRTSPTPPDSVMTVPNPVVFILRQFQQKSFHDVVANVRWNEVTATSKVNCKLHSLYLFPTPMLISSSLSIIDVYKVSHVVVAKVD